MDVTSYLLGKQAGGGSTPTLQNKSVTITENGTTNVTADTGYDGLSQVEVTTNVSGGGADEYFKSELGRYDSSIIALIKKVPSVDFKNMKTAGYMFNGLTSCTEIGKLKNFGNVTTMNYMCNECTHLNEAPEIDDTSNVTNMINAFNNCYQLQKAPYYNTEKVSTFNSCFATCNNLRDVKTFNFASVTASDALQSMFYSCNNLTDESLDNILASCITAVNYTGTKTLKQLGISNTYYYPASRIEALPHYQDFINAGWTIGF